MTARTKLILTLGILISGGILTVRSLSQAAHREPLELAPPADGGSDGGSLWLDIGDRVPDVELVDQNAHRFRLSDLRGQVVVMTFIYTRCGMATMCPLVSSKLVRVHDRLEELGIDDVQFVAISFDTRNDDPPTLRRYADRLGVDSPRFRLAVGATDDVRELSTALQTHYQETAPGVFNHNLVVSLIDRNGSLTEDFFGTQWTTNELAVAIEKVATQPQGIESRSHALDNKQGGRKTR